MSAGQFWFAALGALGYFLLKEGLKGATFAGMRHIKPARFGASAARIMQKAIVCEVLGASAIAAAGFILGRG